MAERRDNDDHYVLFTQNEIMKINDEIAELELLISQNEREDSSYGIDLYCCVVSCMPHCCLQR